MEIKIKANEPPSPAEARMLLTWIGEHYPGLVLPDEVVAVTPVEMVDSGDLAGVQTEMDYDDATGEIIGARCGGCKGPLRSIDDDCVNPDCEYNTGEVWDEDAAYDDHGEEHNG